MVGAWDNEVLCLRSRRVGRGGVIKLTQHRIQLSRQSSAASLCEVTTALSSHDSTKLNT